LKKKGIPYRYADVSNAETFEELPLASAKMIVSTIHDVDANILVHNYCKKFDNNTIFIMSARNLDDAELLYAQ
jgi:hypothetical protein